MGATYQNALSYAKDQMEQGNITVDEANVLIVQIMGVRVIAGSIPVSVRKSLNAAVKKGELGHLKKDGLKPEIYHHKNARVNALEEQSRVSKEALDRIKKVYC